MLVDNAWGCIMADEMGLGATYGRKILVRQLLTLHHRQDTPVHRFDVDLTEAIADCWQGNDREMYHRLSEQSGAQLGE
jgi:hypothetical protein